MIPEEINEIHNSCKEHFYICQSQIAHLLPNNMKDYCHMKCVDELCHTNLIYSIKNHDSLENFTTMVGVPG